MATKPLGNSSRATLAANLRRLIEADLKGDERFSVRAWAMGKGLNVKLIDRLVKEENACTLDTLYEIAHACGLQPWHLLYEDLDPDHLPDKPVSSDDLEMIRKLRRLLGD